MIYGGTTFDSLPEGQLLKAMKTSYVIFKKVRPSMDPRQHNAVSTNTPEVLYDWFDQEETVHVQRSD